MQEIINLLLQVSQHILHLETLKNIISEVDVCYEGKL